MNLGNSFLIKFLMILFSLEGSVSENVKIHSYIGNQIILPRPRSSARPYILIWTKDSTLIADCIANKITMLTKEPDKYHLFLNGTLQINRLKKMDAGNYTVKAHDEHGKQLFNELITLQVDGSVSENVKIHSYIGNQIVLPRPRSSARPHILIWTKDSTLIADFIPNKINIRTKEPNKYHLLLNGNLQINRLKKMDAGNYTVKAHDEHGKQLFNELITLQVDGSVSENVKIHSYIGNQIVLPRPRSSARPHILIWTKDSTLIADFIPNKINIRTKEPNKYHLLLNGNLQINRLKKMDAGNYTVKAHDEHGKQLFNELITLQVDELPLKLNELCSQRILTCEVKSSEEPKPRFKLFQDTKEMFVQPVYDNVTWKVTLQLKVLSGKFRCEVDVNSGKNHTEKQITCPGKDLPDSVPICLILIIVASVVILIIFLALIIQCIRRKKAKRRERKVEEYAL